MSALAEWQPAFAGALRDPERAPPALLQPPRARPPKRRFNVYRNNMVVNTCDALRSSFPATLRLVGDDYFSLAAQAYVEQHPPRQPVMLLYGDKFGDFLDQLPSAASVPYLGDVARLEWARIRALHAADADPVVIEELATVADDTAGNVTLSLHPSLTLVRSRWPLVSLWNASVDSEYAGGVDMRSPQQAVVIRPHMRVEVHSVSEQRWRFLQALQRGDTLADAADYALTNAAEFDLARSIGSVFKIGAVASVGIPGISYDD